MTPLEQLIANKSWNERREKLFDPEEFEMLGIEIAGENARLAKAARVLLNANAEAQRLIGFMTNEKIAEAARVLDKARIHCNAIAMNLGQPIAEGKEP